MSEIGVSPEPDTLTYSFHFKSVDFCPGSKIVVTKREIWPGPKGPRLVLTLEEEIKPRVVGSSRVERVPFVIIDTDVLDVTRGMNARPL